MGSSPHKKRWEEIAEVWDQGIGETGDLRHQLVINPIVRDYLGDLHGKIVLDAGCGNGYISRLMAQTALEVIGVDFTEKMVKIAHAKSKKINNLKFEVGDVTKLHFPNNQFDVVLCNMVLMDLDNLDSAIAELARVTKVGGRVVISTQHPCFENAHNAHPLRDSNGQEIGRVVTNYFQEGLVIDKYEKFPHYHYTVSHYLNSFFDNNLLLQSASEPNNKAILGSKMTELVRNHTPMFIIFKLTKLHD